MSSEPSAVVRRAYDAFAMRDFEVALELLSPEVELVDPDLPEGGTFHGPAGVRRFLENWAQAFSELTIEIERIETEGDRVAALIHQHGTSTTGVPVELRDGHVWTVTGGQIQRIELFLTHEAALAAL